MRITYLDGLRGIACFQVLMFHLGANFGYLSNGPAGVAIFFTLSGYVLTGAFNIARRDVPAALLGRLVRLAFPSIASLFLSASLVALFHEKSIGTIGGSLSVAFEQITGLPIGPIPSLNPPLWTISIEIVGSLVMIVLVCIRGWSRHVYVTFLLTTLFFLRLNQLSFFVFGHLLCVAASYEFGKITREFGTLIGLGLIASGVLITQSHLFVTWSLPGSIIRLNTRCWPELAVGTVLVFSGVLIQPMVQQLLNTRAAQYAGKISFSIYLVHWPIINALQPMERAMVMPGSPVAAHCMSMIVNLALVLLAAVAIDRVIDRPSLHLAHLLRGGKIGRPADTAPGLTAGKSVSV